MPEKKAIILNGALRLDFVNGINHLIDLLTSPIGSFPQ